MAMTVSENIRVLARDGVGVSKIARQLGISYQHAYNVLKNAGMLANSSKASADQPLSTPVKSKPSLLAEELMQAGFELSGRWVVSKSNDLSIDGRVPKHVGVYAFAKEQTVLYVGLATMGLSKRLYLYANPHRTQQTNERINNLLKNELQSGVRIDIYTAAPPNLDWNGLPIHSSAGLELGLIKKYALPWNVRSAG